MTTLLGIETSCDETAAAVVVDGWNVRSNVVASQIELHAKYGGVVPEIASRAHIERLDGIVREALSAAGCGREDIDAIAVTHRPGLVGSLLIGVTAAKTLSWAWCKPLVGVNHIEAHACSAAIGLDSPPWPAIALVVSGGHSSLYRVDGFRELTLLGQTTDDAAGEAFDKVGTILNLPFPGGPAIDKLAREGDPSVVAFPRAMLGRDSLDFSFSGIKTAVLYEVNGPGRTSGGLERLSAKRIADIAAGFQAAVVDVLVAKTLRALDRTGLSCVVVGGGVAANGRLRSRLPDACAARGATCRFTPMAYCTDNAAMIAALGHHQFIRGETASLGLDAQAG
ncbi:MAG: tRNA (adenosine(37)-N6)-threonylcarbamoyltransferase complex transferase subunit TsaD [Phycisphaerales bacterium]|nr:tRNA (adenosine(37)-N6)-threonylcarbamoyltransferase complex transferase subunit TsaD [Phycisphaerales bacterium]